MNNKATKFAVCTVAYNESEHIGQCIKNWEGVVDTHLVLVSSRPWNGSPEEDDGTYRIAKNSSAKTILGYWKTEAEQRNFGLAYLYDYDYVFIVDADEFYTKEDQAKMLADISEPIRKAYRLDKWVPAFRANKVKTYWKTPEYVYSPGDRHKPVIAVNPKEARFLDMRNLCSFEYTGIEHMPFVDATMHHMSYAKSDAKVLEKINSFSHFDIIHPGWYDNVWKKWTPGSDMLVRPYGIEQSVAAYDPAPQEILELLS